MKHLREIKYKTNEAKSRFDEGKTCFRGKIIHNLTLQELANGNRSVNTEPL